MRHGQALTWYINRTAHLKKKDTVANDVQTIRPIRRNGVCGRPVEHPKLARPEVRSEKYRPRPRCVGGRFWLERRLRLPCQGWLQSEHRPRPRDVLPG